MALRVDYSANFNGVHWKSGLLYSFSYKGYEHDPKPFCIFINRIYGIHPNTGHQHRYIQCINLNYLSRTYRKQFADDWVTAYGNSKGNIQFTWLLVKRKYPYLEAFIRRYVTHPNYYISNLKVIPFDQMAEEIRGSWFKDFSTKVRIKLFSGYRKLQRKLS